MDFWTIDEFKTFINTVDNPITYTIFNLLFCSGMREGEILALTLNDFDFNANTVDINKNFTRLGKKDIIQEPKTPKSKRKISLPISVMNMVKEHSERIYGYKPNQRLFTVTKNFLHREMSKYSKLSGIKRIRIHDIRHSHASMLIEIGIAPLAISERLGHEDIQTTLNTYSHLYPNKQGEIAQKLESFID